MVLPIDRHPDPRPSVLVERTMNGSNRPFQVGSRRRLPSALASRMPQLKLRASNYHNLHGRQQHE